MKKSPGCSALACAAILVALVVPRAFAAEPQRTASLEGAGGFDSGSFARFIQALGGTERARWFAYSGTAYDVPSGRVIATVEGDQQARVFRGPRRPDGTAPDCVVRRAFLLYRAPADGAIIAVYPDVRANVTPPPLSISCYRLEGDRVASESLSGVRGKVRSIAVPESLRATREDDSFVFRRVLAPPNPREQPVEIQETVLTPRGRTADIRTVMTKSALNVFLPPEGGRHLLHLIWRPVPDESCLSPRVREFIVKEAPAITTLPATLDGALREFGLERWPADIAAAATVEAR